MRLPVSETSLKEACEGGDSVEVGVLQLTVGGDGVSPHQIPHTEIIKGFIKGKVGHGMLKDMLRGGIWTTAISGVMPRTGGPPPDMRIGVDTTRVVDMGRVITRDVVEVANIARQARRHVMLLVSDDGIIPPNHHPLYNLPFCLRHQHSLSADPSAHGIWPWQLSQIMMSLWPSVISIIFVPVLCIGDDSCPDGDPHSFLSFSHIIVPPSFYL